MPSFKSGVVEISETQGLGPYVLGGTFKGLSRFRDRHAGGDTVRYSASDRARTEWRKGTLDRAHNTLSRGELLYSTTGASIDWGPGRRIIEEVIGDDPGEYAPVQSVFGRTGNVTMDDIADDLFWLTLTTSIGVSLGDLSLAPNMTNESCGDLADCGDTPTPGFISVQLGELV